MFYIKAQDAKEYYLTSANDIVTHDGTTYLPDSGLSLNLGMFNDSAENHIILRGIFEKTGVDKGDNLVGSNIKIMYLHNSKIIHLVTYICTQYDVNDLDFEIQTPLKIFPFALMDTTLNDYMKLTPRQSLGKIRDLKNEVKAVNGTFITLFHNESLSDYLRWKGWKKLYDSMIKIATS